MTETGPVYVYAQKKNDNQNKIDTISWEKRWSVRTNALDWLLTVPNLAVELDLSGSVYNHYTIGLSGKWNWNTSHNFKPATVFDIWNIRPEFRYYWRTRLRTAAVNKEEKRKFSDWLKEYLRDGQRVHPKPWRAYYIGGYLDATGYSFKVGRKGIQGTAWGAGFSIGYGLPLYTYKRNVIDLELGGSLGWICTRYDVYGHDSELDYYPRIDSKCRDWHLIPYPVITDLHISFVYRLNTIQNKYKQYDPEKLALREQRKAVRKERQDSLRALKKVVGTEKVQARDSLRQQTVKKEKQKKEDKKMPSRKKKKKGDSGMISGKRKENMVEPENSAGR